MSLEKEFTEFNTSLIEQDLMDFDMGQLKALLLVKK